jgi:hypothetical protein
MAFQRGTGSVEVELSRVQSWVERADPDLYGRGGDDLGIIREHSDELAAKKQNARMMRRAIGFITVMSTLPAIVKLLEMLHWIPR